MSTTPAPRRMTAEQRREQLLDVLAALVLAEGFGAVSIDRVAREAEIARTVVYSHFGTLDGLLDALVERTEQRALRQVRGLLPDLPVQVAPDELLVDALSTFLHSVQRDPTTWRLALFPVEGAPPTLRRRISRAREALIALLEPLVQWGLRQLDRGAGLAALDAELMARIILTCGEDAARLVLSDPGRYPPERLADFAAAFTRLMLTPR